MRSPQQPGTMDTQPSDAPAAAVYPGCWVMLNHRGHGRSYYCYPAEAENSVATCLSSAGKSIQASFRLEAPPGNSALFLDWPDVPGLDEFQGTEVIAAHGDSVLIQARDRGDVASSAPFEYFVYRAGGGGPPSMSRLPPCYVPMPWDTRDSRRRRREPRTMHSTDTGLLRRGAHELAVAQLTMYPSPELCVLRSSGPHRRLEWETKQPSVIYPDDDARGDVRWETDAAVPIGARFLICWVDYFIGLLLCDVLDDEPVLQYVPLPVEPNPQRHRRKLERPFKNARNIGTTAGGAVRFVSVDHRCCCGGLLESNCPRSRFFFTLTTWTLDMDSMTWTTDGVLHSDELWALPGYEDLPRVTPEFPVISMEDTDAVCLMVRHYGLDAPDRRIWMIKVDTRSKTLLSVVRYNTARYKELEEDNNDDDDGQSRYRAQLLRRHNDESHDHFDDIGFIPSEFSKYL
uniref:Uncharacterized protein n=1 Tax=Avena sativa TaxID=4498 RepID=A0ACD5WMR1_AVESA